jgi:hypothetical protein
MRGRSRSGRRRVRGTHGRKAEVEEEIDLESGKRLLDSEYNELDDEASMDTH